MGRLESIKMIHRIYSSLESFKELHFHGGLNIVLAKQSNEATERHTRNGAGKSSFVEIAHFLLGAKPDKKSIFRQNALIDYWFGIEFDLNGFRTVVEHTGKPKTSMNLVDGNYSLWSHKPRVSSSDNAHHTISDSKWKKILASQMFNFSTDDEEFSAPYSPSFRMLFPYFARRMPDGFRSYLTHHGQSGKYQYQVPISFLLGLDWKISQELEVVRREIKGLKEYKSTSKREKFDEAINNTGILRSELATVQRRYNDLETNLRNFKVLPEYRLLEKDADNLTQELSEISNSNMIDRRLIEDLQESLILESAPSLRNLRELYEEANILLPDNVLKRFEEAREFHRAILSNRKLYLEGEINSAKQRISTNELRAQRLEQQYSEIMTILQPHGAIDQQQQLQKELIKLAGRIEQLKNDFDKAERFEQRSIELELQKNQLELRLQQNFREQRKDLEEASLAFTQVAEKLYQTGGQLNILTSNNGPEFEIIMHGDKSGGIGNMRIFAFDMMLMQICAKRGIGSGFLIHDSHLYDGVDTRQIGIALSVASQLADEYDFQYIVTMNSDNIPQGFEQYYVDIELTDKTETGGLFGFRFD